MKKTIPFFVFLAVFLSLICANAANLHADGLTGNLCMNTTTGQGDDLKTQAQGNTGGGADIIQVIFTNVNTIMQNMAQNFYTAIVQNPDYINSVTAAITLYILVYGIMITLNMASYKTNEIISRLIKIGLVFAILTDGWGFFNYYIGNPAITGMNQLIAQFSVASGGAAITAFDPTNGGQLSPVSMTTLVGPMSLMFSIRFIVIILTLITTGAFGWLYAFFLIWGLIEFILMLIGVIVTYIKAIVGLAFLFGIAPIFFAFILFEKTRQIFMGWLNQVMGFILQPVLLFAFIGFYGQLLTSILVQIMYPNNDTVNFCWQKFIPLGIFDIYWWRANTSGVTGVGNDWDVNNAPPVNLIDILYFLLLVHLGKNLSKFIEQLSRDLSGGSGAPMVNGSAVGQAIANQISGGVGIGGSSIAAAGATFKGANWMRQGASDSIDRFVQSKMKKDATVSRVGGEGISDIERGGGSSGEGGGGSGGGSGGGGGSDPSGAEKFINDTTVNAQNFENYVKRDNSANNAVPYTRTPVEAGPKESKDSENE